MATPQLSGRAWIPIEAAQAGEFPRVCARTGAEADGAIPVRLGRSRTRWRSHTIRIPLSEAVFRKWARARSIHVRGRTIAAVMTAVGIAIAIRNGSIGVAIVAAAAVVHIGDLWGERTSHALEPALSRDGGNVIIENVHPTFAAPLIERHGTPPEPPTGGGDDRES